MTSKTVNFQNDININSNDKQIALNNRANHIEKELKEVQQILTETSEKIYIDPNTGEQIVNASKDKIWFAQNVCFIFSTGAIFDRNDKMFLDSVIDFFNSNNESYLPCEMKTYSYSTDIIQKFENIEAIGNGNYHMCCFVVCYADNNTLDKFPEPMFSHRGICEHLIDQTEIRDEIMRFMSLYGFTKKQYYQPSSVNKLSQRDMSTLPDTKLQYDTNIDYDSATNRELMANIKTKDSTIGKRTRIKGNVNGKRGYPRIEDGRNRAKRDITNQIANDQYIPYNIQNDVVGANVRINDITNTRMNMLDEQRQKQKYYDTGSKNDNNPFESSQVIQQPTGHENNNITNIGNINQSIFNTTNKMAQLSKNNITNNGAKYINYGKR